MPQCAAMTLKGTQCSRSAKVGETHCWQHVTQSSVTSSSTGARCVAVTNKGTQCSRPPQAGKAHCWQHVPKELPMPASREPQEPIHDLSSPGEKAAPTTAAVKFYPIFKTDEHLELWNVLSAGSPESKIHDTQVAYARLFLERLEARIDLDSYPDGIQYVFAQVAKISLRKQTDIRFQAYKATAGKDVRFKKFGEVLPVTTLSYLSGADVANWAKLWEDVKTNPRKLFVVFQDEAHYGAKEGSTASVQVADKVQHFANAVHVCITATPYAIIPPSTAKDGTDNVVPWSAPSSYYDYARLKKEKHVEIVENCCVKAGKSCAREVERNILMSRYEVQLLQPSTIATAAATTPTSLRTALTSGQKIIIRARNDRDLDTEGLELEERFADLLKKCGLVNKKAILVEADAKGENLANSFSSPDVAVIIVKQMLQMGDTFPRDPVTNDPIIAVYDESLQYHGDSYVSGVSVNYDKIHQELGRAFGYYPHANNVTRLVVTAEIDLAYKPPMSAESYYERIANGETFSPRMGITAIAALDDTPDKHTQVMSSLGITKSDRDNYHENRLFVLWAQPQSGKTGAVLWLMKLIAERFGLINSDVGTTSLSKASSYTPKTNTDDAILKKDKVGGYDTVGRCAGSTVSGSQCSRSSKAGYNFCFQHIPTLGKTPPTTFTQEPPTSSSPPVESNQKHATTVYVYEATLQEGVHILQDMEMFEDKQLYVALESNHNNPVFPGEELVTLRVESSMLGGDKNEDINRRAGGFSMKGTAGGSNAPSSTVVKMYLVKPLNTTKYRLDSCKTIEWSDNKYTKCVKLLPNEATNDDAFSDPGFITSILQSHYHSSSSACSVLGEESLIGLAPLPSDNGSVWMQLDHVSCTNTNTTSDSTASHIRQLQGVLKTASGGTLDLIIEQ